MNYVFCILIGYLIGVINPSYIMSRLKGFDIRKRGSGNAGASNALILFGKRWGILFALLDIGKATLAVWLADVLFRDTAFRFSVTAVACILGHVFPFYMKFRGGKGLACLGGAILYFDWRYFLMLLAFELVLALVTNYICFVPLTASVIFPVSYGLLRADLFGALILAISTAAIFYRHAENIVRIKNGSEMRLSFLWNKKKEKERLQDKYTDL